MRTLFRLVIFSLALVLIACCVSACAGTRNNLYEQGGVGIPESSQLITRGSEVDSGTPLVRVRWSPKEENLLLLEGSNIKPEGLSSTLYSLNSDTKSVATLMIDGQQLAARAPAWSADGKSLAYFDVSSQRVEVARFGQPMRVEFSLPVGGNPAWSPTGEQLVVLTSGYRSATVYQFDRGGQEQETVFHLADNRLRGFGNISWSPDGKRLAFSLIFQSSETDDLQGDIFVLSLDSGVSKRVTSTDMLDEDEPGWTPSGRLLTYLSRPTTSSSQWRLMISKSDGSCVGRASSLRGIVSFSWSPNGRQMAIVTWLGDVYLIDSMSLGDEFNGRDPVCN